MAFIPWPWKNRGEPSPTSLDRQNFNAAEEALAAQVTSGAIPLPSSVVSSGSIGYLSLRNDFALNPSMSAASLTTKINEAIVSAISAGKGLDLGADLWPIEGALTIGGNLALRSVGAAEVWGGVINSDGTQIPGAAPWVEGGGFVQEAAGANILDITSTGVKVDLHDLVLAFGGSSIFSNTGHAVYGVPSAYLTAYDNGPTGCRWDNIVVFGHDGNHYAFYTVNLNYLTAEHLRSYGGGGWFEECNTAANTAYGNSLVNGTYFAVLAGGSADGFHMKSGKEAFPNDLNLVTFVRPQANILNIEGKPLAVAHTITKPTNAQQPYRDVENPETIQLIAPDWEAFETGFKVTYGNNTQVLYAFGANVGGMPRNSTTFGYKGMNQSTATGSNNNTFGSHAGGSLTTGENNIAIGTEALKEPTTQKKNVAIGTLALAATTVNDGIAIGTQALAANTTGVNLAIGSQALTLATTGTHNIAIGYHALTASVSGAGNLAIGHEALAANTASNNFAIGYLAGAAITSGANNVALGSEALKTLETNSYNIAIGLKALELTTAGNNLAIGVLALGKNSTAEYNIAIGRSALELNTTGGHNLAIGHKALGKNETGGNNLAIGFEALAAATGSTNLAIGYEAGSKITSGANNTAIGSEALKTVTTTNYNVAIGPKALEATTASNNVAVGVLALAGDTSGEYNIAIGRSALEKTTNGSQNVAVGHKALAANVEGKNNVAIGYEAGAAGTAGTGNVFVGYEAGRAASGSNELFIANNETTPWIQGGESGKKIAFLGGVPVARHAAIAAVTNPTGETTVELKAKIEALNTAVNALREVLKVTTGVGLTE